jgi:hypothetical protein
MKHETSERIWTILKHGANMWPPKFGDYVGVDVNDDVIVRILTLAHSGHLMTTSRLF